MVAPLVADALIQGGTALAKYAYNRFGRKDKDFNQTPYGSLLQSRSQTGLYSPQVKSNILGTVGKATGSAAQTAKGQLKGNLISSGFEGSIAGQGKLAGIDTARMNKLGDVATDIETKNEISKEQAKEQFALAKGGYQENIQARKDQNTANLVGGLLDTAGTFAAGSINQKLNEQRFEGLDLNDSTSVNDFIRDSPNADEAIQQIYKLAQGQYYSGGGRSGGKSNVAVSPMSGMSFEDAEEWYMQNLSNMTEEDMKKAAQLLGAKVQ